MAVPDGVLHLLLDCVDEGAERHLAEEHGHCDWAGSVVIACQGDEFGGVEGAPDHGWYVPSGDEEADVGEEALAVEHLEEGFPKPCWEAGQASRSGGVSLAEVGDCQLSEALDLVGLQFDGGLVGGA